MGISKVIKNDLAIAFGIKFFQTVETNIILNASEQS
jgi:hypothetical protein